MHIVLQLINQKKDLLFEAHQPFNDYPNLVNKAILSELDTEISELTPRVEKDTFVEYFQNRCKIRAHHHHQTLLSFTAMPFSPSNELYWNIANTLFQPLTMGDMLRILLPEVQTIIKPHITMARANSSRELRNQNFNITLTYAPLQEELDEAPELALFSYFIVGDGFLFDVRNIANFHFDLHQKLECVLTEHHPYLAKKLYTHNIAMKTLHTHLAMVSGAGRTPMQVLQEFRQELKQGGTTITGQELASLRASIAFTDFMAYLEAIPSSLRGSLLALKQPDGKITLNQVIEHLRGKNCVEVAAAFLQNILINRENYRILTAYPYLQAECIANIKKQYRAGTSLPCGFDNYHSFALPSHLLKKLMAEVNIYTIYDLINCLLMFPPSLYLTLFKKSNIFLKPVVSHVLANLMKEGLFNEEQRAALFEVIISYPHLFGRKSECLYFAIHINSLELFIALMKIIPLENRLSLMLGFIEHIEFFHRFEVLQAVLKLFPPKAQECLSTLFIQKYFTEWVKLSDTEFEHVLNLFSATSLFNVLHQKNKSQPSLGYFIFQEVAKNPVKFQKILEIYPPSTRLNALTEQNSQGHSVMLVLGKNLLLDSTILSQLPRTDRFSVFRFLFAEETSLRLMQTNCVLFFNSDEGLQDSKITENTDNGITQRIVAASIYPVEIP